VVTEFKIIAAEARSICFSRLLENEETHFIPAVPNSPPKYAGRAMILFV
jgi:hypothetical protein